MSRCAGKQANDTHTFATHLALSPDLVPAAESIDRSIDQEVDLNTRMLVGQRLLAEQRGGSSEATPRTSSARPRKITAEQNILRLPLVPDNISAT